jgi:hypothetical protein
MTILKLADMLIPGSSGAREVAGMIQRRTLQKSALFRSGIIARANDAAVASTLALEKGGYFTSVDFRNPLSGAEQIMNDTKDLVINKISYGRQFAAVYERANSWGVTDLGVDLSGDDPMADIVDQLSDYWAERYQIQLINILNGAMPAVEANLTDISEEVGEAGIISANNFITASRKLGDRSGKLTAVSMHSAVMTLLIQQNLIIYLPAADQGDPIPTYQGKTVIEDDGMPFDPVTGIATMYLYGRGAISFQEGTPKTPLETDRASLTNGGQEWIVNRKKYIMHPNGISWNIDADLVDPTPNNAELADPDNWEMVYDPKEIGIAQFTFRVE